MWENNENSFISSPGSDGMKEKLNLAAFVADDLKQSRNWELTWLRCSVWHGAVLQWSQSEA